MVDLYLTRKLWAVHPSCALDVARSCRSSPRNAIDSGDRWFLRHCRACALFAASLSRRAFPADHYAGACRAGVELAPYHRLASSHSGAEAGQCCCIHQAFKHASLY